MNYHTLPDIVAPNLKVIFIGYNPGLRSAEVGHYFAGVSNRFWYLMYHSGLVKEKLTYADDQGILRYGYGLTDIVKRPSKSASEISKEEFIEGSTRLKRVLLENKPQIAAYLGIGIYKIFAGKKKVDLGLQTDSVLPGIIDFVLPSPSGLNRLPLAEKLAYFSLLNELVNKPQARILANLAEAYPEAAPELVFHNPFQCLLAVMMSAQSTDKQVNKVTEKLFALCHNPWDIVNLPLEELEEIIKGVGLYKTKAKNIRTTCQILIDKYQGQVPDDFQALTQLPGVGRKTANVVISCVFGKPALAVDTHVFRVANRLGLAQSDDVVKTEEQLKKIIPKENWSQAHHWLIFHGRRVCDAKKPKCMECLLRADCHFYRNQRGRE